MEEFRRKVEEAARHVAARIPLPIKIGLVLGTGLGSVADAIENSAVLPYEEIPHFPRSTVTSHQGRLVAGTWARQPVLAMQGRFHLYEGYSALEISFPIRVMRALGIDTLFISNAAGGLNPQFQAGELMLIADHINFTGHNPLVGPNVDAWGDRFPDMTEPYSRTLQETARSTALELGMVLHRGVYVGVLGPNLETAAETRFLRAMGADAVGMSTIMEVITAVHAGMKVLGISAVSNVNLPDHYLPAPLEEIIATAEKAGRDLSRLLEHILPKI